MREEIDYSLKQLTNAFGRLREGINHARTDLAKDGVVQRFEFTFELLWKCLKVNLEHKGVVAKTPKDCLQAAFRLGWINDDAVFSEMLEARNKMSHQYDEAEAKKVFKQIKKRFIQPIRKVIEYLDNLH